MRRSDEKQPSWIINAFCHVVPAPYRSVERHDCCHSTVDYFCGFFFVRLDVSRRVGSYKDVIHHPAKSGMSAVGDFSLQYQLHQLLCRRRHILEGLSERNDRETHTLKGLHHLHSAPAVKFDFSYVETLTKLLNKFLNVAVMNHIALGDLQKTLPLPHIIRHMVSPDTQFEVTYSENGYTVKRRLLLFKL